jgi:hypothetical protein
MRISRTKAIAGLAALALLAGVSISGMPAHAAEDATTSGRAASATIPFAAPLCSPPLNKRLDDSPRVEAGYLAAEEWLAGDQGQRDVHQLDDWLERESALVVGVVPDHDRQRVLVIVDQAAGLSDEDLQAMQSKLEAMAPSLDPELRLSCNAKATLDATMDELHRSSNFGVAGPYGFAVDASTATVSVTSSSTEDSDRIAKAFGKRVTIHPGQPGSFGGSRTADYSAHFGDASIANSS